MAMIKHTPSMKYDDDGQHAQSRTRNVWIKPFQLWITAHATQKKTHVPSQANIASMIWLQDN